MHIKLLKLFISIIFPFFVLFLFIGSQEAERPQKLYISGTVIDSLTQEPIPFTTVSTGPLTGSITDDAGSFRIPVFANGIEDSVYFSCIGYKSVGVPIANMLTSEKNEILLSPNVFEMNSIVVRGKSKRSLRSKQIILKAIQAMDSVYYDDTIVYEGYYREYIKDGARYLNLFESIMNVQEYNSDSIFGLRPELLFKKVNRDFPFNPALEAAYDNKDKYVPHTRVHGNKVNELLFLRESDPIKNRSKQSLSFFNTFKKDFIHNHSFDKAQVTYFEDRPYYAIEFNDNQYVKQGLFYLRANGKIYVDAETFGIKKIEYLLLLDKGSVRQKLYELNVEYKLFKDKYALSYASFNNLFMIRNFQLVGRGAEATKMVLEFNRNVNKSDTIPRFYKVLFLDQQQEVERAEVDGERVLLTFKKDTRMARELRKLNELLQLNGGLNKDIFTDELMEFVKVELFSVRDQFNNPLESEEFSEYYQYREFFVHRTKEDKVRRRTFNFSLPVFENTVWKKNREVDTSWMNTPLIRENTVFAFDEYANELYTEYIGNKTAQDIQNKEELIYLHADREVYAPLDTIWFKAYVRSKDKLNKTGQSNLFFVRLLNSQGEIVLRDKFLVDDSDVKGQLLVPHGIKEGIYFLNVNTSWMENFGVGQTFTKKILIKNEKRENIKMLVSYDKSAYFPGDEMKLEFRCLDPYNRSLDKIRFDFEVLIGDHVINAQKGQTDLQNNEFFSVKLPAKMDTLPTIKIHAVYQGLGYFFDYPMPVDYFLNVNFFPEGGHLINGLQSVVAFKAETRHGLPLYVEGRIKNSKDEVIEEVYSEHDGMGKFELDPHESQSYYLDLEYPECFAGKYPIPAAENSGLQLSIETRGKRVLAEITNSGVDNDTTLLTVMVRNQLVYFKAFSSAATNTIRIPFEDVPHGVAVVTVFDHDLIPRAERLFYNTSDHQLSAEISTNKTAYTLRDSVSMKIQLDGDIDYAMNGSYSLSVVDNELCSSNRINEAGIETSLLLSPEIQGKIHEPAYYFNKSNKDAPEHLDLLLMTQGWRNYRQLTEKVLNKNYQAPKNMEIISGTLMKPRIGREASASSGTLKALFGGLTSPIPVNDDGTFSFLAGFDSRNNSDLILFATDDKGTERISIELDQNDFREHLSAYLETITDSLDATTKPEFFTHSTIDELADNDENLHYWLDEVVISKKVDDGVVDFSENVITKKSINIDEVQSYSTVLDVMDAYSHYFKRNLKLAFFVDGFRIDPLGFEDDSLDNSMFMDPLFDYPDEIDAIEPKDITAFSIVRGSDVAVYGFNPIMDSVIVIDIKLNPNRGEDGFRMWKSNLSIPKFTVSKEFYKPVYNTEAKRQSPIPDLRKTIHWDNNVRFDENGEAQIKFYNGDRYTRIKCILEGLDERGVPVHDEYMYNVE